MASRDTPNRDILTTIKKALKPSLRVSKSVGLNSVGSDWGLDTTASQETQTRDRTRSDATAIVDAVKKSSRQIRLRRDNDRHHSGSRRRTAQVWRDLDELDRQITEGQFFGDIDKIIIDAKREIERIERYRERRKLNGAKAARVLKRLNKVRDIDLFKMTQHIPPDFFAEKHQQFDRVKVLYLKKDRLVWHLLGLYMYLAFDVKHGKWHPRRGLNAYSVHREFYMETLYENHLERLRQRKWDIKRARVRSKRNKATEVKVDPQKEMLYKLQRGVSNNVPVIPELLDPTFDTHRIPVNDEDDTNWDD